MTRYMDYGAGSRRLNPEIIQKMNTRVFFQSGGPMPARETRPWQYVDMEYRRMGLTPPASIPPLESIEDADIWMCLDERVNRSMRLREESLAV